jgi:hypothetical protein
MSRAQARLLGAGLVIGGSLLAAGIDPTAATPDVLSPSMNKRVAGVATGSVSSLAIADQSGAQLDPSAVMTFGPGPHRNERSYQLPASIPESTVWGITVETHVRAPAKSQQVITWYLRDFATNRWIKLDNNIEIDVSESNSWQTLEFFATGTLADYVSPTGEIRLRVTGTNRTNLLHVDAERLRIDHGPLPVHPGWIPPLGTRWQYELQPPVLVPIATPRWADGVVVAPTAYDIDLYEADGVTPAAPTVGAIHAAGARAVCYVSAGSYENWRPDAAAYPAVVLGAGNGWPGEKWVDIRRLDVLIPILDARVAACAAAGFDAVEFDNVDGAFNRSGFPLSRADQVRFNRALADVAHSHGLSVGLKNDLAQLTPLFAWYDFAINEQCSQYGECSLYNPWTAAGKHVVQVEYSAALSSFCPDAIAHGRSAIKKDLSLEATPYTPCS